MVLYDDEPTIENESMEIYKKPTNNNHVNYLRKIKSKPLNVKNLLVKNTITHSLGSLLFLIYVGIISRKNTMLRGVVIITRDKVIVMNI